MKKNHFANFLSRSIAWTIYTFMVRKKYIRNEIKNVKTPYVVIANHASGLDFANIHNATKKNLRFLIGYAFYNTISKPMKYILEKTKVITMHQTNTKPSELVEMKKAISEGDSIVLYPAGIISENGVSMPITTSTIKCLKWLGVDVYVARTYGAYFSNPIWSNKLHGGKVLVDIYKLIDKDELSNIDMQKLSQMVSDALIFNSYDDQRKLKIKYPKARRANGLENVLYKCPKCGKEFMMQSKKHKIFCLNCGYERELDKYGFFKENDDIKDVAIYSKYIHDSLKEEVLASPNYQIIENIDLYWLDIKKRRFVYQASGKMILDYEKLSVVSSNEEKAYNFSIPLKNIPVLPFDINYAIEVYNDDNLYKLVPKNGKIVMKCVNLIKIFYEINNQTDITYF